MGRIKNVDSFGRRNYKSAVQEPNKIIVIAVEGNRTEIDYFTFIKDFRFELGISSLLQINLLERDDTNSSPAWVKDLLNEYRERFGVSENDSLWMIIDRDVQNNSEEILNQIISQCKEENFTSPPPKKSSRYV